MTYRLRNREKQIELQKKQITQKKFNFSDAYVNDCETKKVQAKFTDLHLNTFSL